MKFFVYDNVNGNVSIDEESILLIKEFTNLLENSRNITKHDKTGKQKTRALREFKYIYLFFDWTSPYFQFTEQDRNIEALKDSELTQDEFDDPNFRAACQKYIMMQDASLDLKLLKSAMSAVEKQIFYLDNVDLQERDPVTGKPIFKSKDLIAEIKGCRDLISTLRELEVQVKRGLATESTLRGNTEIGMFD
mgnify:CR=1 FL=1